MRKIGSLITRRFDARAVQPEAKKADPFYLSPEYRAWREAVIARAGRRCQDTDERTGHRCSKAEPRHRMFADHVVEVKDGGARYDIANGRCLCGSHHTIKTAAARAARLAAPSR
jgi:5-methylcytosine-specific restriction protein A